MEKYVAYLKFLNDKLDKLFNEQAPYIACKKGCTHCCKNAQFPFSQQEIDYLMIGLCGLEDEKKDIIVQNMQKIFQAKKDFKGENFEYDCPCLIDEACAVYDYRGIVCRSFGLLAFENEKIKAPFCNTLGLNYSNVMSDDGSKISGEKWHKSGIEVEPMAYNVSYEFLTGSIAKEKFGVEFTNQKPLIDWFEEA